LLLLCPVIYETPPELRRLWNHVSDCVCVCALGGERGMRIEANAASGRLRTGFDAPLQINARLVLLPSLMFPLVLRKRRCPSRT
jgi:hypothetical protein